MQSVLVFLSNRPTLCSIYHCWLDQRLIHLVFQQDGYLLLHSTPVSCFHFIQASLTGVLMSLSAPPFESNIDPKYLNVVTVFRLSSPSCISSKFPELLSLSLHGVYAALSGWLSIHVIRICFAISSSLSTASWEVSHRTRSSANNMAQGGSLSISKASTSMMMMKSRGLIANPWCCPTFTLKYRKPYNKEAQEMLSVIPYDLSKDAWIAATWKQEWEASGHTRVHRHVSNPGEGVKSREKICADNTGRP